MADDFGTDPEKMLDMDKKLREQSEFVKKAIDPLLKWKMAYEHDQRTAAIGLIGDKEKWIKYSNETPNEVKKYIFDNCKASDLVYMLSDNGNDYPAVALKLRSVGIEGTILNGNIDYIFDDKYIKSLEQSIQEVFGKEIDQNK